MPYKDLARELSYRKEYNQRPDVKKRHNEREKFLYHSDPEVRARNREYVRQHNKRLKRFAMDQYGGQCVCCGEQQIEFLCLDHINNDGGEQRTRIKKVGGIGFYKWLKAHNWPEGLQVLCANCNLGKQICKECPHKHYAP